MGATGGVRWVLAVGVAEMSFGWWDWEGVGGGDGGDAGGGSGGGGAVGFGGGWIDSVCHVGIGMKN